MIITSKAGIIKKGKKIMMLSPSTMAKNIFSGKRIRKTPVLKNRVNSLILKNMANIKKITMNSSILSSGIFKVYGEKKELFHNFNGQKTGN
jgi:hypothetical protein